MNILSDEVVREAKKRLGDNPSLQRLWEEIEKLQRLYEEKTESKLWKRVDIQTREGQELIKRTIFYIAEELFEISGCLKNRVWTQTQYEVDVSHLLDEVADTFLFFIILCHQLGLDAEKLLEIAMRKVVVNEWRVKSGY